MDLIFSYATDNTAMVFEVKVSDGGISPTDLTDGEIEDIFDALKDVVVAHYPLANQSGATAFKDVPTQVVP